ncbi:MAG TPA: hypothetical protein PKB15_03680 [Acidimicrobiia bacterium]|nr:hypothetical protein [Acidimicrobiia bacterium]
MGLISNLRRGRNGEAGQNLADQKAGLPLSPLLDDPEDPLELHRDETITGRFLFPNVDPVLHRMLIALGASPIFEQEDFPREHVRNTRFCFYTLPSTLSVATGRESRPNEFPDGISGMLPKLLRTSDGLVLVALDEQNGNFRPTIGTSWKNIYNLFEQNEDAHALPDLIANAGYGLVPTEPQQDDLRLYVEGVTNLGAALHAERAFRIFCSEQGISKSDDTSLTAFNDFVAVLREPFVAIGQHRAELVHPFIFDQTSASSQLAI